MRDGVLYSAWREGKAFYFYRDIISRVNPPDAEKNPAAEGLSTQSATSGGSVSGRHADYKRRYVYSVDMDTGNVY